jgi:hypothetical protein
LDPANDGADRAGDGVLGPSVPYCLGPYRVLLVFVGELDLVGCRDLVERGRAWVQPPGATEEVGVSEPERGTPGPRVAVTRGLYVLARSAQKEEADEGHVGNGGVLGAAGLVGDVVCMQ